MENSGFESIGAKLEPSLDNGHPVALPDLDGSTCRAFKMRVLGKWLFIKTLKPELITDSRLHDAFRKELEIGFQLDHPGLPRYVPVDIAEWDTPYIAMEWIEGLTLDNFIRQHPDYFANSENLRRFVKQMADVIDYLHNHQILHLDIKPRNVMITDIGHTVKLLDLGFAHSDSMNETSGRSPAYAAPEQIANPEMKSQASDYYAFGRLLEYIRQNTPHFPRRQFCKLERELLIADPQKRIADTNAVNRLLARTRRYNVLIPIVIAAIIGSGLILFWQLTRKPEAGTIQETSTISAPSASEPSQQVSTPSADKSDASPVENRKVTEINIDTPRDDAPQKSAINIDKSQAEADLKQEIRRNQRDLFTPVAANIRKAIERQDFTTSTYNDLNRQIKDAIHESFITSRYEKKYSCLSADYIQMTVANEMEVTEKDIWLNDWKQYAAGYSRRHPSP